MSGKGGDEEDDVVDEEQCAGQGQRSWAHRWKCRKQNPSTSIYRLTMSGSPVNSDLTQLYT